MIEDLKLNKIKSKGKKFIDIGSGFPIVPNIMHLIAGYNSIGLEYNQLVIDTIDTHRKMSPFHYGGIYLAPVFQGNLLEYDFKDYDVLYAYSPIRDHTMMLDGIDNIIKTMKQGAVFYFQSTMRMNSDELKNRGLMHLKGPMFKYIKQ